MRFSAILLCLLASSPVVASEPVPIGRIAAQMDGTPVTFVGNIRAGSPSHLSIHKDGVTYTIVSGLGRDDFDFALSCGPKSFVRSECSVRLTGELLVDGPNIRIFAQDIERLNPE